MSGTAATASWRVAPNPTVVFAIPEDRGNHVVAGPPW